MLNENDQDYKDLLKEIATRKKTSDTGNWTYHPKELDNLKSFDELQQIFNKLGLDFCRPVRSKWSYEISDVDFVEKVNNMDLDTEGKTEVEKWVIGQVKHQSELITCVLNGGTIIFQD
tara:strand:+ start:70 stop:423 length:354 start_codon:yes stop_codon:yes gene_type:complete